LSAIPEHGDTMSVNLGSAHGKIELDASGAKRGVNEATSAVNSLTTTSQNLSAKFASMGQTLSKTGATLTKSVTLPIVGIGTAAAKMSIDFDREMRNVSSISDAVRGNFEGIKKQVLELSTTVPQSATVLAKGLYQIVSAGYDGADAMKILESSAKSAAAGLTDTDIAADAATTVLNAWAMKASDVDKVQDIMFQTVKRGKTTYEELASSISTVASTAATAKVPFEQVGAAYATMTKAGLTTAEAGVALNQVLLSFIKPTDDAWEAAGKLGIELSATALASKGLDGAVSELAKKVGITSAELEALEKSGMSEAQMMEELAKKTGMSVENFAALFPNVRALKGALSLVREEGKVFADDVTAMYSSTGAAADAYAEQSKSVAIQLELMKSSLSKTAIEFGDVMAPAIAKAAAAIGKFADWLGKLSPAQKKMVVGFMLAAAAIGPLLLILGKIAFAISSIISVAGMLAPVFAGGLAPILTVVAALAAAVYLIYKNWTKIGPFFINLFNVVKKVFSNAIAFMVDGFKGIGDPDTILGTWGEAAWKIGAAFRDAFNLAKSVVETFLDVAGKVISAVSSALSKIPLDKILEDLRKSFSELKSAVEPAIATLKAIGVVLGVVLAPIIIKLAAIFLAKIAVIVGVIRGLAQAFSGVVQLITGVVQTISGILGLLVGLFTFNSDLIKKSWGSLWMGIQNIVGGVVKTVLGFISGFVAGIIDFFIGLYNTLVGHSIIPDLVNAIIAWIKKLPSALMVVWNSIKSGATSTWNSLRAYLATVVPAMINATVNFFAALPSRVTASFKALYNGIVSVMKQVATAMANLTKGAVDKAVSFFASLPNKILSYISRLPGQLYSMAQRIASSFWNGFKKGLGISSPSYVERAFFDMEESALQAVKTIKNSTGKMASLASMANQIATPASMIAPGMARGFTARLEVDLKGIPDRIDKQSLANLVAAAIKDPQVRREIDVINFENLKVAVRPTGAF